MKAFKKKMVYENSEKNDCKNKEKMAENKEKILANF